MLPRALKGVIMLVLSGVAAILLGSLIGEGDYGSLLLLCYAALGLFLISAPGYIPLVTLGLLNPFVLPIPFVHSVPFLGLMLAVCGVKLAFHNALSHVEFRDYKNCVTIAIGAFFAWVLLRYLAKPVLPNLSGFGSNVTGFRSYLSYAICFGIVVSLPLFIKTRQDVLRLFKWLAGISCVFILLFIPLVFSKSVMAGIWLQRLGLFVGYFDNGLMRFVVMPGFGLILVTLAMCPALLPLSKGVRRAFYVLGVAAIIMGGTRSSAVMAVVVVLIIYVLRLQFIRLYAVALGLVLVMAIGTYIVENTRVQSGFGFMRILALTSARVARETDAASTWDWRMLLWERALAEIKQNPILGKGYGGVENAWVFSTVDQFDRATEDVNMASGGIHNGFITCAYSLGIPSLLLFLVAFGTILYRSARQAFAYRIEDPMFAQMQQFIVANLVSLLLGIFIGADLNGPTIWFYLTLGVLFTRIKQSEAQTAPERTVPVPAVERPARSLPIARPALVRFRP